MFINPFMRHSTINDFHIMVLDKTQGTYILTSSSLFVPCIDSVSFHYLNVLELLQHQNVSHMMRKGNNLHRLYQLGKESELYPTLMEYVLLVKGSYVGTWLRNMQGFFVFYSQLKQCHSTSILTWFQPQFSQSNSITMAYKKVSYSSHNQIIIYLAMDASIRAITQWLLGYINDLFSDYFMSFQPTNP